MVLLYDERDESSAIIYRFPPLTQALTPVAVKQILRRADDARLLGATCPIVVSRSGGQLRGLDRSAAEAVAFWIADAALDPDLTTPLSL